MINCPNCSGNLKFDILSQMMHCEFCGTYSDPYDYDSKTEDGKEISEYETTVFTCPECAGEIASTDTDVTGFCPFCGASTIFYSRLEMDKKPDYIIPFQKTKDDCKDIYAKRVKKMLFVPKEYKDSQYIDGFRGIYIPYWYYRVGQRADYAFTGTKTRREGDYIVHENYSLKGDIDAFYEGFSHDASTSFTDDISERISPFDVKQKQDFTAGFLSGFYADMADVNPLIYNSDAVSFAFRESEREIKSCKEYRGLSMSGLNADLLNTMVDDTKRVMYPVWFMSYRNKNRVAYATVNGQTGKVAGDFPIDLKKFFVFAAVLSVILFGAFSLFLTVKATTMSIISTVFAFISLLMYLIEWGSIKRKENKTDDKGYQYIVNNVMPQKTGEKAEEKAKIKTPIAPVLSVLMAGALSLICFLTKTIHDEIHYIVSAIASAGIAYTLICLIKDYNLLSTRPLPQFEKKGGDDRA